MMYNKRFVISTNSINGVLFKGKIINLLCLFYLLLWILVPAFSVMTSHGIFRILFAIILFAWILTAIENLPNQLVLKTLLPAGVFLCVMGIYGFLQYGDINFYDFVNYGLLIGFALNGMVYCKINSEQLDLKILNVSFLLLIITTVTTLKALFVDSNAARLLTSSSTDEGVTATLRIHNVGAFDFIYGLVIIFPLLIITLFRTKNEKIRIYAIILTIVSALCVVKSNFTTAVLLLFIGIWLPFIFSKKNNLVAKILIILFIVVIVPMILPYFLNFIYEFSNSILAKEKIMGILSFMNGTGEAGNMTSRLALLKLSLTSFLKNPIFGVGGYYRTTTVSYVGKHAQFVDDLARYGIVGGIPLAFFLIYSINRCYSFKAEKHVTNSVMFPSVLIFGLLGFLNPIYNYGILAVFFIVVTTLSRYIERKDNK